MAEDDKIAEALHILGQLGMPRAQQNPRSALCLLALLNLTKEKSWARAEHPLVGITPMMEFARDHYGKLYAPNTRETFAGRPFIKWSRPASPFTTRTTLRAP
jgi:hypothetical protein